MKRVWAALLSAALVLMPTVAHADPSSSDNPTDPALTQVVGENEKVAPRGQKAEISAGHVDMGPKLVDGKFELMVRDDSQDTPTWRHLEDVVFRVSDHGKMKAPEGKEYSFVQAEGPVWVVPQQEVPNVVWLGWNTQDPGIVKNVNGSVELIYSGYTGPGAMTMFVQAGNFSGPTLLWDTKKKESQPVHVELNNHTHANWVFTKPGEYGIKVNAQAQLKDGTKASNTQLLKFAVGDEADAAKAHQLAVGEQNTELPEATAAAAPNEVDTNTMLPGLIGLGLIVLTVVIFVVVLLLRRRARSVQARAEQSRGQVDGRHDSSAEGQR